MPRTEPTVYLFLLSESGKTYRTVGILPLSAAKESIARGTGKLAAVDVDSGIILAATNPSYIGHRFGKHTAQNGAGR